MIKWLAYKSNCSMMILIKAMIEKWSHFCVNDAIILFKPNFHQFKFLNCCCKSIDSQRLLVDLRSFTYCSNCHISSSYVEFLFLNSARTSHPVCHLWYAWRNDLSRHRSSGRVEARVLKDFQVSFRTSRCNRPLNSSDLQLCFILFYFIFLKNFMLVWLHSSKFFVFVVITYLTERLATSPDIYSNDETIVVRVFTCMVSHTQYYLKVLMLS